MKIILRTTSTNPNYYGGCECAVLEVTPTLLADVAARVEIARKAAQADVNFWKLYFWICEPVFYGYDLIQACNEAVAEWEDFESLDWEDQLQLAGVLPIPDGVGLDRFEPQRTECDQMVIYCHRTDGGLEFEVGWIVIPKHGDIYITTEAVTPDRLHAFVSNKATAS